MKQWLEENQHRIKKAAAFGRLCVETNQSENPLTKAIAAAFGRLCVETNGDTEELWKFSEQPPSGGCVLKLRFVDY